MSSQYPAHLSKHLPSHHALLVRVLADIRRAKRRMTELNVMDDTSESTLNEGLSMLYNVIMTIEMDLGFMMQKALRAMEEEE